MARQVLENGVILPAEYSDDWYDDMTSNLTKLDDVIGSDSEKLSSTDVGAAALSNNYNDLDNLPTIPTVNDAVLTIQKNGVDVQTFTANASSNVTANITVPTKTSDLTNDSDFVDISNPAVSSGITSAKVSDYDTHIADTDIHVTTADKNRWNTVSSKANDSDVVHKSGNETVAGVKTFANNTMIVGRSTDISSAIRFVNSDVVGDSANGASSFEVYGSSISDANKIGSITIGEFSNNGGSYATIECNRTVSGVKSSNTIRSFIRSDGSKELSATVDNDCKLGTGFLRWSKIYGTEYYYGSNNVEFSTKFVTTDTAQTISETKTFSSNVNVYNSDNTATTPNLYLRSSKIEISSQGNTSGDQNLTYLDKNNTTYAYVKGAIQSNGSAVKIRTIAKDSSDNSVVNELQILAYTNGNKAIFPTYSNETDLGVSNYKWKSIFATNYYYGSDNVEFSTKFVTTDTAQTISGNKTFSSINGVEPSSLSLPSGNVNDVIDISSYLVNLDGTDNTYVAPANGWITINMNNCSGIHATITGLWSDSRVRASAGAVKFLMPVLKNQTVTLTIHGGTINNARFIPCQGNV